jgi:hypothetical protein
MGEVAAGASQLMATDEVSIVAMTTFSGGLAPPATFAMVQRTSERPTIAAPFRISS